MYLPMVSEEVLVAAVAVLLNLMVAEEVEVWLERRWPQARQP